jgi:8-oxo-dGTP pyrophosphatase MutT (NUDIX family)
MSKSWSGDNMQFAALPFCYGEGGRLRVMLVTSRETKRWVIPKGWPVRGRKPHEVAAQEAFEEAGLLGTIISKRSIGGYHYEKQIAPARGLLCKVSVFLFRVDRQLEDWPEKTQRETQWFEPSYAANLVDEGELARLLRRVTALVRNHRP